MTPRNTIFAIVTALVAGFVIHHVFNPAKNTTTGVLPIDLKIAAMDITKYAFEAERIMTPIVENDKTVKKQWNKAITEFYKAINEPRW